MAGTRKSYLPARVDAQTLRRLERRAKRLGRPRSSLVQRYVEEGLRMDEHPGIAFVEGPAGRRAALAAFRGLDVWQVVSTLHDNRGDVREAAAVLSIPESEGRLALAYYADHRAEIDDWIRANEEEAEELQTAGRRQREAARG